MTAAPPIVQLIAQGARARGVDPRAAIAVAKQEGLSGGIGDGGHAYGPFQLNNAGGVITNTRPGTYDQGIQRWATSPQGVAFALDRIAGVAKGLKGPSAVRAIVSRFERPANPGREISNALAAYGSSGAPPVGMPPALAGGAGVRPVPMPALIPAAPAAGGANRSALLFQLAQQDQPNLPKLLSLLAQRAPVAAPAAAAVAAPAPVRALPPAPTTAQTPQPGSNGTLAELLHEYVGGPTHSTGEHIHFASADPQTELAGINLAEKLGLHVGENPYVGSVAPGVHARNSYHYRTFPGLYNGRRLGEAVDASGTEAAMTKLYQLLQQRYGQ